MSQYRYELKFILDESKRAQAMAWLYGCTGARVAHPPRIVNSVYFDDPGYSAVCNNLAGIAQRHKIRLRWYNSENAEDVHGAWLEVKHRNGRLGRKDKYKIPGFENDLLTLKYCDLFPQLHAQLGADDTFLVEDHLFPALHVSYEREYFEGLDGVRITFDRAVWFYLPLPHLRPFENTAISYPHSIMEIKFPAEKKDAVADSLRALNLTPKRHSKYLAGLAAFGYATYF